MNFWSGTVIPYNYNECQPSTYINYDNSTSQHPSSTMYNATRIDSTMINIYDSSVIQNTTYDFNFDTNIHNVYDILNLLKNKSITTINFRLIENNNESYGPGANRYVYLKILNQLSDPTFNILIKKNNFVDVNNLNIFWTCDLNIWSIAKLFMLANQNDVKLPYHLNPLILEQIIHRQLTLNEFMYFLEYYDRDIYTNIHKITDDFIRENTNYDSKLEYVKSLFFNNNKHIYEIIGDTFSIKYQSVVDLNEKISGPYIITRLDLLSVANLNGTKYENQWSAFIHSLTMSELKNLLLTFGNTLDLNEPYNIIVSSSILTDIKISTCSRIVMLNEKIFESGLDILKIYLVDNLDTMSDRIINLSTEPNVHNSVLSQLSNGAIERRIIIFCHNISETLNDVIKSNNVARYQPNHIHNRPIGIGIEGLSKLFHPEILTTPSKPRKLKNKQNKSKFMSNAFKSKHR